MQDVRDWTRNAAAAAPKLEYQVAVAIAAVILAAFVGRSFLEPARPAAPIALSEAKMVQKLPAEGVDEGTRLYAASAAEFAVVYGPAAGKSYTTFAAAEWSSMAPAAKTLDGPAVKPQRKATLVAQLCAGACSLPTASAVVPPPRPAELTRVTEANFGDDKRVRLLGLSLPGFVPSGERIAKTVVSWGGSVAGVIPGL